MRLAILLWLVLVPISVVAGPVAEKPPGNPGTEIGTLAKVERKSPTLGAKPPAGAKVRAVAAQLVARVLEERTPADDLLPAAGVTARDQPLLAALVFGALRWHYRLEWQANRLLTRPLARDQGALGALLRIGLLQLQELRVPEHAAVSATVDATVVLGLRSARGLVNAVLRKVRKRSTYQDLSTSSSASR